MLPLAFGFGGPWDIAILGGVLILLFGGSKLAGFGKSLGEGIKEFKKATNDDDNPQAPGAAVYDKAPAAVVTPETPVGVGVKTEEKL